MMHKSIHANNKNDLVTLRNLPPELGLFIRKQAKKKGLSLNKTVIDLLQQVTQKNERTKRRIIHDDLDALAGSWSKQEAKNFEKTLCAQRAIDTELWK